MTTACLTPPNILRFVLGGSVDFDCKVMLSLRESTPNVEIASYLVIFILTCLLEAVIYLPAIWRSTGSLKRGLEFLFWGNIATHPAVIFIFPLVLSQFDVSIGLAVAIKEIFAPVVEAIMLKKFAPVLSGAEAAVIAFAANLLSWWVGCYIL